MSDEIEERVTTARRDQIKIRLNQFKHSRQRKVLGIAEIAGLAGAAMLLLLVLISYFYFSAPARQKLEALQLERSHLQRQLRLAQEGYQQSSDTKTTVETINTSLEKFETGHLVAGGAGRMALYTELNQLIRRNNVRNTSGPAYNTLPQLGTKQSSNNAQQGNAKWQSVFPGISVSVTVEGSYQNLRHFLRDIETSHQFLIVNSVELETTNESNAVLTDAGGAAVPKGSKSGIVSLRLDMATYFQRPAPEGSPAL